MKGMKGQMPAALAWLVLMAAAEPALAKDIGDMARAAAQALEGMPVLLQIFFYVLGFSLLGGGLYMLVTLKKPGSGGSAWMAGMLMAVGAIFVAIPEGLDVILGTFGLGTGGGTIQRPKL